MAATPALEVRDLQKRFGGVPVLSGVCLSLFPGQVTGLAGENGAGKSTLMKIATGQLRQDGGEVLIDGEVVSHADPILVRKLGVAIVPQELAPYPDLMVYGNPFVGRERRGRAGLLGRGG